MNTSRQSNTIHQSFQHVRALWIALLVLFALPPALEAQFTYIITNGTVTITKYTGPGGAVVIPGTISGLPVTRIGDGAFAYCTSLSSVTIPDSITSIGQWAFENCFYLTSITIPNSVTSIGAGAFVSCSRLASFTIPNGLTSIADNVFNGCNAWVNITIPSSVTSIGASAFGACGMSSITIPDSVTSLGPQAFQTCRSLTDVAIGRGVTSIGDLVFDYCDSLRTITVDALNPAYSSVDGVLFDKSQTRLVLCPPAKAGNYTMPDSVTAIADFAFYFCTRLTGVTIGNCVTSIEDHAFWYCTGLTNLTIGNGVTDIGDYAFYACSSLANVTIPNGSIGYQAFYDCFGLTSVMLGAGVTSIGSQAFSSCSSLGTIAVDALNPSYSSVDGVLFDKRRITLIQFPEGKAGPYTIPGSVTSIGDYAFGWCIGLSGVAIPNGVTGIGDYAFVGCRGLTSVTIPDGVTRIGDDAFADCTGLTSVTIPDSVTSIGASAFRWCAGLRSVTIGNGVATIGDYAFGISLLSLTGIYFEGNAPSLAGPNVFSGDSNTVYYLPGTAGWGSTFGGRPTSLWLPPLSPQTQTAEIGSAVLFRLTVGTNTPLGCQWFFNRTSNLSCTNAVLQLVNVQLPQAGTYTVVVTNAAGAVTSAPAMLGVIPPVERRWVPGLTLMGQPGSSLNLDFTAAVGPAPKWTTLDNVPLGSTPQWYFDVTIPLPPQRFYRAWQSGTPAVYPSLNVKFVPVLAFTGTIGNSIRVDGINQFGPTNAWFTLNTVTLTNTSQLYFDVTAPGQPARLYRLVQVP